jgi:hypothetical protein
MSTGAPIFFNRAATIPAGTPKPPFGLDSAEANTVATTCPDPSTAGPPELPDLITPRIAVIRRRTGPAPYASWLITVSVAPSRPGSALKGPSFGNPRIATGAPTR